MAHLGAVDWCLVTNKSSDVWCDREVLGRVDRPYWAVASAALANSGGRLGTQEGLLGSGIRV